MDAAAAQRSSEEAAKSAPKPTSKSGSKRRTGDEQPSSDGGVIGDIANSKEFKDFIHDSGRTLVKEIARGVFNIGRR